MNFEIKIIEFLQSGRTPFFDISFQVISLIGSYMGIILTLGLLLFFRPKLAFWYVSTSACAAVFSNILKRILKRERPCYAVDTIVNIGDKATSFSMPSGHIISACIIAIFLGIFLFSVYKTKGLRILTTIFLSIYVVLVGISRMYLGKHYLTDLLVGLLIAICFSVIFIFIMRYYHKGRFKNENKN